MDPTMNPDMNSDSLTQFYNNLKDRLVKGPEGPVTPGRGPEMSRPMHPHHHPHHHGGMMDVSHPAGEDLWRHKMLKCRDELKDRCCKHLILDIYCKILPLDKEYVDHHHGMCKGDVDQMLKAKNMNAVQYLTSCYESTHAPLLEYLMRSTDMIARQYMEEAEEEVKNAKENEEKVPEPETPDPESDENIQNQLVDVKSDTEYDDFIDKLKKKTINKIVSDVSKIINDKKQENEMTFTTDKEESPVGEAVDYLQKQLWNESQNMTPEIQEQMIGMAIREATLHQFDVCFRQPTGIFKEYASHIRLGKGYLINESAVAELKDQMKHAE